MKKNKKQDVSSWDKSIAPEESGYYWNKEPVLNKREITSKKLSVVEIFCGCGGTTLGFEMAGFEAVLGCDIHIPSVETFQENHLNASTILGDARKVKAEMITDMIGEKEIDVLIAGVPCQGFSLNNRKRHEDDKRNQLYKEFSRLVKALKPRAVVLENVSGMRSTGSFVEDIEKDLSNAAGMTVKSKLLYAPDYGVPQRRRRLVFVGVQGEDFDFDTIKKTHGPDTKQPYVTIREAIGDLPALAPNEQKFDYASKPLSNYQALMRANSPEKITNHKSPNHPKSTIDRIKNTKPGEPMYPKFKQRIRLSWDDLSPTQVSGGIRPQFQFGHPLDDRGLTIRERCRIQSFPDDFSVSGGIVQGRVQTGNAVPPLLAKAIALAIKRYLS